MRPRSTAALVLGFFCLTGCDRTERDWKQAKDSLSVNEYEEFLQKHPGGPHSAEARILVASPGALADVKARPEYATIAADLSSRWTRYLGKGDLPPRSSLERQAVLDVIAETFRRAKVTSFAVASITPLPTDSPYGIFLAEGPKDTPEGGTVTWSGTVSTSQGPQGEQSLKVLGMVRVASGMAIVGTGATLIPTRRYDDKGTIQGVRGSVGIRIKDATMVLSTALPRDRIVVATAVGASGVRTHTLLPTGAGSVYALYGRVEGFFPGITVTADGDEPVYFAVLKETGLTYLAGVGTVTFEEKGKKPVKLGRAMEL
jgi:hypothetical protein